MTEIVALLGLFLLWASLLWMPLAILRAVQNRGGPQTWSIAAILTFLMAFMGYTRAMAMGTAAEAFAWSVSWAMPIGLALLARSHPDAVFRKADVWLGAVVLTTFILVLPAMPGALRAAATLIWG